MADNYEHITLKCPICGSTSIYIPQEQTHGTSAVRYACQSCCSWVNPNYIFTPYKVDQEVSNG